MNEVVVTGGSKAEKEIVEKAVYWCIKKLLPRVRTLDIEVSIRKLNVYGYCLEGDNNRHFELEIKKGLSLYDLISTVCHEMVHVKQYAKREMSFDYDSGRTRWKAKLIADSVKYEDQPWEKEAFKLEEDLALQCFKEIKVSV